VTPRVPVERRIEEAGLPPLPRTAWLEIDLDALRANLAAIRTFLPAGARVDAVVKADAYGHGAGPVSRALEEAGADGFCVVAMDEAAELRAAGVRGPILVLYAASPAIVAEAARLDVALTVADRDILRATLAAVARAHAAGELGGRDVSIHLEVETGLGRDGVLPRAAAETAAAIAATPGARFDGFWTHLAAPGDRRLSAAQARSLEAAGRLLEAAGLEVPRRHMAASGAVLRRTVPALDGVRVGLAMYGLLPDTVSSVLRAGGSEARLRPVLSLHARPTRVADLPAGHGIGYGPAFTTSRPSRIATLPLGYGDGYARDLASGPVLVRGRRAPIVGRISMDSLTVDVTDVPGRPVTTDDEFTLLGRQGRSTIDAAELAGRRGTIVYEVVCSFARRLPRVYHSSAGAEGIRTLAGEERREWLGSSSGAATSATSRSTRS
jgi:alanine racemase